jgi:hypothetical protein
MLNTPSSHAPQTQTLRQVYRYDLYGLVVSSPTPLPARPVQDDAIATDVVLNVIGELPSPDWGYAQQHPQGDHSHIAMWPEQLPDGSHMRIRFDHPEIAGHTEFAINPTGSLVSLAWTDTQLEDAISLFMGATISALLRLRGMACLHASVVRIGDRAIAFLGDKGAGKSTTAGALATYGGGVVLSDDIAALRCAGAPGDWTAYPGDLRLRLWPEALKTLAAPSTSTDPILSIDAKRALRLDRSWGTDQQGASPIAAAATLSAIYVLEPRDTTSFGIETVPPVEALMTLSRHVSLNTLPLSPAQRASEFQALATMPRDISMRRLRRPNDLTRLSELSECLLADVASLP